MLLFHEGGKNLDDVSRLQYEQALLSLVGCDKLPSVKTLGNLLRRTGSCEQCPAGLVEVNKRFGYHDQFAIRQIGKALGEFFSYPPPHIVQSFGSHATLFASRFKSQVRR